MIYIPCFVLGMLVVTIYGLSLGYLLKCSCNRAVGGLHAVQCRVCGFDVLSAISRLNSLATPAYLGMTPQIACRLGITFVKESSNKASPAKTLARRTLKDMGLPHFDILNRRYGLEKYIDW